MNFVVYVAVRQSALSVMINLGSLKRLDYFLPHKLNEYVGGPTQSFPPLPPPPTPPPPRSANEPTPEHAHRPSS